MAKKATTQEEETIAPKETTPIANEASTEEQPVNNEADQTQEKFAKAGKKSKKHIEEVQAEAERQARKASAATEVVEKKAGPKPVTRSRLERRGKNYRAAYEKIEKGKSYALKDAIALALETSPVKFDATVEMHFRLNVDPRQADQNIRSTVTLPAGTGKDVRVAVFAPLDVAKKAKAAGADIAEDDEFLARLDKEQLDFDVLIATPQYMPKLGKYARLLGPKGLMPNPKAGTVTNDIEKAVSEAKSGKIEYRVDKQSIVHVGIGKVSFGVDKLNDNAQAFIDSLKGQKPASIKGSYIKSVHLSTTMGPSLIVENTYN
ncbi:50S ribosomal protein L1 [Candidatus Saccharibacteria bacterium]|nr:50S ribosomal protein L1 [Candidatus Saccharibacteria bacterium]